MNQAAALCEQTSPYSRSVTIDTYLPTSLLIIIIIVYQLHSNKHVLTVLSTD